MGGIKNGYKMKKTIFGICVIFLLFFVQTMAVYAAEKIAVVKTRENFIREFDRFYAPVKLKVKFEDKLKIIETKGDWLKVSFEGTEGWIHAAAVVATRQMAYKPVLLGAEIDPEAEEDEVTLAGKGFNAQVEQKVGEKNPALNFALVDDIVNYDVSMTDINKFIKDGELKQPE